MLQLWVFSTAQACAILAVVMYWLMIDDVNRTRPREQQMSHWGNIKVHSVFSEHRRLYPESRRRTYANSLFVGTGLMMGLLILMRGLGW